MEQIQAKSLEMAEYFESFVMNIIFYVIYAEEEL